MTEKGLDDLKPEAFGLRQKIHPRTVARLERHLQEELYFLKEEAELYNRLENFIRQLRKEWRTKSPGRRREEAEHQKQVLEQMRSLLSKALEAKKS